MRRFLSYDSESGKLRLVFTDLYAGQHERTEYTVVNDDGSPVRRGQEFDGLPVFSAGYHYVKVGPARREVPVRTYGAAETVKTPCRRFASKSGRARCALCSQEG